MAQKGLSFVGFLNDEWLGGDGLAMEDHGMGDSTGFLRTLEASRKELLDLTTRNRLLDTPRNRARAKTLEIVDEGSDQIAKILMKEGRPMSFLPAPDSKESDGVGNEAFGGMGQPEEEPIDEQGIPARHLDTKLQTSLSDKQLQKKLLTLFYDSRTHEEEHGVNILYLALGFLKWYDSPSSDRERFAPLILLPARLVRSQVGGRIRIEIVDEDLNTNLSLQWKLRMDFGIKLPNLPDREELVPSEYFAEVRPHIQDQPRWDVLENDIVLSFFSFARFLMYRDLSPDSWPSGALGRHEILSRLLGEGFQPLPPLWPDDDRVEDHVKPIDQIYVLDADGSQTRAIEEVKAGRSMVIQGPPGTGKSQTITNLIAAAVEQGKKVLFVAEKMAALEVVHRRLAGNGLGQLCLELHSRQANKKQVLAELQQTLEGSNRTTTRIERHVAELQDAQNRLNQHADLLHAQIEPSGLTPYRVLGELVRLTACGVDTSTLTLGEAEVWSHETFENKRSLVATACERIKRLGIPVRNPWRGIALRASLPSDRKRLEDSLAQADAQTRDLEQSLQHLSAMLGTDPAVSMTEASHMAVVAAMLGTVPSGDLSCLTNAVWREGPERIRCLVNRGKNLSAVQTQLESVFVEEAWSWDPRSTRKILETHGHSLFRIFRKAYRDARKRFRRAALVWKGSLLEQMDALDALQKGRELAENIENATHLGVEAFGHEWKGISSAWTRLDDLLTWVEETTPEVPVDLLNILGHGTAPKELTDIAGRIGEQIEACYAGFCSQVASLQLDLDLAFGVRAAEDVPLAALRERIDDWRRNLDKLLEAIELSASLHAVHEAGLSELAHMLFIGDLSADDAVDLFSFAYYDVVIRAAMEQHPLLATFRGHDHDSLVESFKRLDLERIELARQEVASAHAERMPSNVGGIGEIGVLRHEFAKKRKHLSIRKLMKKAGNAIQRIKPVFMMSPVSISQFLPPGVAEFDLLLIDEASQVKPVDAFGAILRSKQVVVVGDDKQLPPSNFFGRSMVEEDEDEEEEETTSPGDLESILTLCSAKGMPSSMLRWHYRSQHQSLIAVSNREFYGNRLHVVPSPFSSSQHLGLRFHFINDGCYDRGGSQTNRVEARRVARAAVAHARQHPQQSLGIGTFSAKQKEAILDELERLWRTEQDVRSFFSPGRPDPFFVKNLETIQGDERDVIFISVGYGPDKDGRYTMRFGPLNNEGGERRLNVLISRARMRCEVFSSMRAQDIVLPRDPRQGVAALKTFLNFAEAGRFDTPKPSDRGFDSPFEEEVHRALTQLGHTVDCQIGMAGFYIDLAIRDPKKPGRYLLGVECDGATYHRTRSARDRDRIRQQVLESRGWIIHRIWSTDWFHDPERQLRKVQAAIEEANLALGQRDRKAEQQFSEGSQSVAEPPTPTRRQPPPARPHLAQPPVEETPTVSAPSHAQPSNIQPYTCAMLVVPATPHPENPQCP